MAQMGNHNLKDANDFIEKISALPFEFFDKRSGIFVTRAPGRLDVMGGIADYSGSLVLEMPIAEAVFAALQKTNDKNLKIISEGENGNLIFEMRLEDFSEDGGPINYAAARDFFRRNSGDHWAAYVAGAFLVLMRERGAGFEKGAKIYISSNVPQGKGVSSSAALEAAIMSAVGAGYAIEIEPREMALLCQKVENLIAGAPCGIMDQMSVICGKKDELLPLVCQPAQLQQPIKIPDEICFWGIDSGIRHAVVGADYGSVRTGAFMGYRIIAGLENLPVSNGHGWLEIADDKWHGYLANITPIEFEKKYKDKLPEKISGAEFLKKCGGMTDEITSVFPKKDYAIFYPAAHPIYENARVHKFAELLGEEMTEENLSALGGLMYQAHESYSACGLGSSGTDLLVELVKKLGTEEGLYGAKITGGGSGGTVAVLGLKKATATVERVVAEYENQTGYKPYIFSGSSVGAADFGFVKLVME